MGDITTTTSTTAVLVCKWSDDFQWQLGEERKQTNRCTLSNHKYWHQRNGKQIRMCSFGTIVTSTASGYRNILQQPTSRQSASQTLEQKAHRVKSGEIVSLPTPPQSCRYFSGPHLIHSANPRRPPFAVNSIRFPVTPALRSIAARSSYRGSRI